MKNENQTPQVSGIKYIPDENTIALQVLREVQKQRESWGLQTMPDIPEVVQEQLDNDIPEDLLDTWSSLNIGNEVICSKNTTKSSHMGELTYSHVLIEEVSEAVCAKSKAERRAELIQVAAVAMSWIHKIDRGY